MYCYKCRWRYDVYVADIDGDGDLDIVSASMNDDTIAWYENNGAANPTFTAANIDTNADGAHDVKVADMDGDGDLDIVSASMNDDTIAWYENNGAADPSFVAADIVTNADGATKYLLLIWMEMEIWIFFPHLKMTTQLPGMKIMERQIQHLLKL